MAEPLFSQINSIVATVLLLIILAELQRVKSKIGELAERLSALEGRFSWVETHVKTFVARRVANDNSEQ